MILKIEQFQLLLEMKKQETKTLQRLVKTKLDLLLQVTIPEQVQVRVKKRVKKSKKKNG